MSYACKGPRATEDRSPGEKTCPPPCRARTLPWGRNSAPVGPAHPHPAAPPEQRSALRCLANAAMSTLPESVQSLLARTRQLYSLPAVAMRVLDLASNPQIDTRALKECIENDPALTAKILRVVNSSLFGLSRQVSDLNQALALLGIKPLKLLTLGFSLPPDLFQGVAAETLEWYWRRSLTRAVAAREISQAVWRQPGDEAFLAGLLRDLGMLLLIQELGPAYHAFLVRARAVGGDLRAMETQALGFDHLAVTAALLRQWHLPDTLCGAVQYAAHCGEAALAPAAKRLAEIVELAELVAGVLVDARAQPLKELLWRALEEHGISSEQLARLATDLELKVQQLAEVLSVGLACGVSYTEALARAQANLAETAAAAAEDLLRRDLEQLHCEIQELSAAARQAMARPPHGSAGSGGPLAEPAARLPAANSERSAAAQETGAQATQRTEKVQPDRAALGRLAMAVAACRQTRSPLSLLVVELVGSVELTLTCGREGFGRVMHLLERACAGLDHPNSVLLPLGETGLAVILPDCDRRQAVVLGHQVLEAMRRSVAKWAAPGGMIPAVAAGVASVAMPPKNFPAPDLWNAAQRCLNGSRACGGGVVKSIEIY